MPEPQFSVWAVCLWCGGTPPETDDPMQSKGGGWAAWIERWMQVHSAACSTPPAEVVLP